MDPEPSKPKTTPSPEVACTVLIKTTVGQVICRKGAKIRLPKADAETLAGLNPPHVEITGI